MTNHACISQGAMRKKEISNTLRPFLREPWVEKWTEVLEDQTYSSSDWLYIAKLIYSEGYWRNWSEKTLGPDRLARRCYENALKTAGTLSDCVYLASYLGSYSRELKYRKQAYEKILEFEITSDEDIELLCESLSERLKTIGWFLMGRKKHLNS